MNPTLHTSNPGKAVVMEARDSGIPPQQSTAKASDPKPPKRYTVDVVLVYRESPGACHDPINEAVGDMMDEGDACIPARWNNLPMAGVLAIELQFRHFLDCLQSIGVAVELGRESDPDRLEALRAMLASLPKAVVLEMMEGQKDA